MWSSLLGVCKSIDGSSLFFELGVLQRVPACSERWFQRLNACEVSKKNFTNFCLDFFFVVMGLIALFT